MFFKTMWKAFLWAFVIFLASGMPGEDLDKVKFIKIPHMDKMTHFFMYFLLSYLCIDGFKKQLNFQMLKRYPGWCAVFFSAAYGVMMEWLQLSLFSERSYEVMDIGANTLGAVMGWYLFTRMEKLFGQIR